MAGWCMKALNWTADIPLGKSIHPPQITKQVRMRMPHCMISFTFSKHMHLITNTMLKKATQPSSTGNACSITYSRAGLKLAALNIKIMCT
jgi:hypothetical protein